MAICGDVLVTMGMIFLPGLIYLDLRVWCLEKINEIFPKGWFFMVINPMGSNP